MFAHKNSIRGRIVVVALFLVALQLASMTHAAQAGSSVGDQGFMRTKGTWFTDQAGNVVVLRGVMFDGYQYGLWNWHSEEDYMRFASWGFNVVRLPIAWDFIEPKPGKYDQNYFRKYVDKDIQWAKKYGLYVVLDMQQYGWSSRFTYYDSWHTCGVPAWSVSGYANTAKGEASAKADFYNNLGPNGTPVSAANPSMQDRFIALWKYIASMYAGETVIAAYDILNEPTVYSSDHKVAIYDPDKFYSQTEVEFLTRVTDAIRTVDSNHIIIWEPTMEGVGGPPTGHVDRPNVAYSPHYPGCDLVHLTFFSYDGNKQWLQNFVSRNVIALSELWNQPVFVGEWGITVDGTNATQLIRDFLDVMDLYHMSGTWFGYGRASWGMYLLDESGSIRAPLVQNLVRPYASVASSPFASRYDAAANMLRLDLKGPAAMKIYLPDSYSSFTVTTDSGAASSSVGNYVLSVSLANEVSQLIIQFA